MNYSKLIEEVSVIVANQIGCDEEMASDYIEKVVFNTECDLRAFFQNIFVEVK